MTCWHGYAVINLPEGSCRQRISQRIPGRGGNLLGALAQVRQRHQPCIVGRRLFQIKGWMLLGQPAAQCPTQHLAALRIGSIRLNWRLIQYDTPLIDYVIAHELAHLAELNHSPHFWAQLEALMPDYRVHQKRLANTPDVLVED